MSVNPSEVVTAFTNQVRAKYDLGEDFITEISKMMTGVLTPYHIFSTPQTAPKAPRTKKAKAAAETDGAAETGTGAASTSVASDAKKQRKASAYNIYVKEKMQEEAVKAVPQKEKMGMIGKMWAALSAEQKLTYSAQADAQNASASSAASPAAAAPASK